MASGFSSNKDTLPHVVVQAFNTIETGWHISGASVHAIILSLGSSQSNSVCVMGFKYIVDSHSSVSY